MSPARVPHARQRGALVAALGAAFVGITALRFAVDNPIEAVGFLYVIPISVAAAELGWRAGAVAAAVAMVLVGLWVVVQEVDLGLLGYAVRAVTFGTVALTLGAQADRRRRVEDQREAFAAELHAMAMIDQLTGLPNRRAWDKRLAEELARAREARHHLTVVAMDLDRLKQVNDTQGHDSGDELIIGCVRVWREGLRDGDFVARVGGDEFLMLLPGCDGHEARRVVERMIDAAPPGHLFSTGIATWSGLETAKQLVGRADRAMYVAKAAGGGRVEIAGMRAVAAPPPLAATAGR